MSTGSIRQRGEKSWQVKFDLPRGPDGRRQTRTATVRGSRKDAQRELRKLLLAVDRGEHVDRSNATVGEFVAERIAMWEVSRATREHLAVVAKRLAPIANTPIQKLTTRDVERWHGELRERGLSAASARHAHRLLARALAEAVRHGLTVKNAAREQPLPKARGSRPKVEIVNGEQIPELLQKLEGDALHTAVIVALYTGIRRGEQLALTWADVDLDGASMTIARALEETKAGITVKSTKTSAGERTISLPQIVIEALRQHRRQQLELRMALGQGRPSDDALVFPPHDGGYQSPRCFSLLWRRTVRRLGLPASHWHSLRHTHASMLIAAGVDVVTVSRRLGHASPNVTLGVYSHLFAKDDRAAAEAINAALGQ